MTIKQLQAFIKWLRAEKIAYSTLSAGGVTLDGVVDMKIAALDDKTKPEPRRTMFERYGDELMRQPTAKSTETVPDEAMID